MIMAFWDFRNEIISEREPSKKRNFMRGSGSLFLFQIAMLLSVPGRRVPRARLQSTPTNRKF